MKFEPIVPNKDLSIHDDPPGLWSRVETAYWRKVDKSEDCWPWLGSMANGSGSLKINGRKYNVLRLSWLIAHGKWPAVDLRVCRTCTTPQCVRPEHLFLGTLADSARNTIRKGRTVVGTPSKLSVTERFESFVGRAGLNDCWPWSGARNEGNYGEFRFEGRTQPAHRVAWTLKHGPVPRVVWVLHTCDNPPCCNPKHLFLGDHKINMADRHAKGRDCRGAMTKRTPLTEDLVRLIRSEYAQGGMTQDQLANKYGLKRGASVCRILNGTRWGWVQ